MGDLITWKIVGGVSAINGVACFALSSTYDMLFGKLGFSGHLVYLLACLIMWCLMLRAKRIRVSQKVQGLVVALIFVVICVISMVFDKLVSRKSDAWSIISYGSFALMSVSMSRKLELGFETGISTFFLQLFAAQLFKIKWFLLPIALVFCSVVIILRHHSSESRVLQSGSITPNGYHPIEVGPPNAAVIDIIGEEDINERQDSPEMGEVSGQSPSSTNNEQNSQAESSQAVGEVSEENISDGGNELNSEQEEDGTRSSLGAESSYSSEQDHGSSRNYQNGWMHSSPSPQLLRRRRRLGMTPVIQNISSSFGDTLRWWHPTRLLFFFVLIPSPKAPPSLS